MDKSLPPATDFTGFERREKPNFANKNTPCPKCDRYGGWNIILDAYGDGKHFQASCSQCNGWGWVEDQDATCVHNMREISPRDCRDRGIPHYGMFNHVYECIECGRIRSYDSSG